MLAKSQLPLSDVCKQWQMLAWLMQILVSGDESLLVINQALFHGTLFHCWMCSATSRLTLMLPALLAQ